MFHLAPETVDDEYEVEFLYDVAFAPGREALSSYRLREGVARVDALSLVARDEFGSVGGAIRYWPVMIGKHKALLLGPVAVHPTRQGEGLGGLLMSESLALAEDSGWKRVILIGDAPYYSRFGFARLPQLQFPPPTNPDRVLAKALVPDGLEGVIGTVTRWTDQG